MAAAIAKFAGSRILKTETMNHFGVEVRQHHSPNPSQ